MATDPDDFVWQPTGGKRVIGAGMWVGILAGCAAAGTAVGYFQPVERLVSAIERNGVATAPPTRSVAESAGPRERPPSGLAEIAAKTPAVVLLNPGTAEEEPPAPAVGAGTLQGGEEREPAPVMSPPTSELSKAPPSTQRTGNTRDRKVLVVVRRVVPPYTTRILRGRITDGRLVVDSRDRRGMNIR